MGLSNGKDGRDVELEGVRSQRTGWRMDVNTKLCGHNR